MDLSISMKALKNVFRFPFADPDWKNKLLMGSGLTFVGSLVPILPTLFVAGYAARVLRAGAANEDAARLPEWNDWGDMFMDGLRLFGTILIFTLPGIIIGFVGWALYMMSSLGVTLSSQNSSSGGVAVLVMLLGLLIFFVFSIVAMLLGLGGFLLMPPAVAHVAVTRRFSALFEVGDWWRVLKANFGGFLIALALFIVTYLIRLFAFQILYLTVVLCFLAPLLLAPISFYAVLIYARLIGQAYGEVARPQPGLTATAVDSTPPPPAVTSDPAAAGI